MTPADIAERFEFLRVAERMKDTLRSAYTAQGRTESVADHTWRLVLLVMTFADLLPDVDLLKLIKICVLHDLGEVIDGDIPAPEQVGSAAKSGKEREDFRSVIEPLPDPVRAEFLSLWDEYDQAASPEARVAKALDKIETILQHNQGLNPPDFDYAFNLSYGRAQTDQVPLARELREQLDAQTAANAERRRPTD